ncbi:vitellogenin-like [Homarus americanus]|uniref:vitellogenin-like n=1 Tax=Homarus americanus TaxID=6706 RepID=UPI001C4428C1|nr:vitellogenin-like [Homarus americanus]
MITSAALLVLGLVVGAGAAPWGGNTPRCSTECPVAGSPKLFYQPEHTYTYTYSGKSQIHLKGVEGGVTETDWSKEVELSWITPCDMVIFIKDSKVDGAAGQPTAKFLEKYPMVVALTDGRVQHVCTHPEDEFWSINIKKGIASAFQNSLPSNSTINSGQNITETDVVGKCPTHYEVEREGDKVIVKKEKNHLLCKERYPTPAETQMPWLKGPLPLEESKSLCKQEITNGIYSSIICEDKNVVRPSYGAYKYVEAIQESTLRYVSLSSQQPPAIPQGSLIRKSLRYSYHTLNKDPSMVAELDQTMTQICEKTKDVVERDAAALVAKAVQLLRRVPEEAVKQTLDKIRAGRYCQDHSKLESLFLDAVSFIHESGAVKVMVDELVSGRATVGRAALYTAAFYLHPRPTINDIETLLPVFQMIQPMPSITLAAASMVNTYCRHNPLCENETSIMIIAQALNNKIQSQCSPLSDEETQHAALITFKALGNMCVMTAEETTSAIRCMKTKDVELNVRVAAAQSFRQTKCKQPITKQLIKVVVDPTLHTEVRIATYLAAVRCAQELDLETLVNMISEEENTQVRGFILSHLLNLQDTNTPHKAYLRYLLTNILVPRDYETDFSKYSRNIDMSYFAPSLGVGAGVESNIIYVPGSFVPRSVDFNFTAALEGISMNIGEVGARLEGLEPVIEEVFGPEGYLQKATLSNIFQDINTFFEKESKTIVDVVQNAMRQKRSNDNSLLTDLFSKFYCCGRSDTPRADIFARLMGQEISFISLPLGNVDELVISYISDILHQIKNFNINLLRAVQLYIDYSFPTIQGTPLKLKLEGTAVVKFQMEGNVNPITLFTNWRDEQNIKIIPSLSVQVDGFVGYDSYIARTGIKTTNTISSTNGVSLTLRAKNSEELEVELDLPEKMELINVKSETYLMKSVRGSPDTKIIPPSMRDVRVRSESCVNNLEPMLGLRLCDDLDVPDIFRSNSLPLGAPAVIKLYFEKAESSIRGYKIIAYMDNQPNDKILSLKVETIGSTTPRETQATVTYTKLGEKYLMSATLKSYNISGEVWFSVTNRWDYKDVQSYASFKTDTITLSRGIKVELSTSSTSNDKEYDVNVYSSNNVDITVESLILETKFIKKVDRTEISLDVLCRTRNTLRNYFFLLFEAGLDLRYTQYSRLPLPTNLRKFEFQSGMRGWQVTSFIRQTRESGEMAEHLALFKLTHNNQDLISVEAKQSIQGGIHQTFVVKAAAVVKLGSREYKAASIIQNEVTKVGASLQVTHARDRVKLVDLEAFYTNTGRPYSIMFLLDIPKCMQALKFEISVTPEQENNLLAEVQLKYGNQLILQLTGPVTCVISITLIELKTDLIFTTVGSRPHKLSSVIIIANNTQELSFSLKTQQQTLISLEWTTTAVSLHQTVSSLKFLLPDFIDFQSDIILSQTFTYVSFNSLLLPRSYHPHRVKGFTHFDLFHHKLNLDVLWDADLEASKRVSVDVIASTSPAHPGRLSIQGNVKYERKTYQVVLIVTMADLLNHHFEENSFTLKVQTPAKKTLSLEVKNTFEKHSTSGTMDTRLHYKNLHNKEYKLTSILYLEKLDGSFSYKFESQLSFTSPEGREITVTTEAKHQSTAEERVFYLKGSATVPTRKHLETELLSNNTENVYNLGWTETTNTPSTMYNVGLMTYTTGGIKSFETTLNMTAIQKFFHAVHVLIQLETGYYYDEFCDADNRVVYLYQYFYHQPTPNTYSMILKTPSRHTEGEAIYSPSEASVKVYPNKRESNTKYELTGRSSHTYWDQESKYEGHISHPSLTRDMRVEVQYSVTGENMRGTIELDIFPDTADKITGTLQSTLVANNTVRVETLLATRILKYNPKIILVVANGPHTVGFDASFQRNATSPVSFQVSAKYDRIFGGDTTVAFRVVTEEGPVVDIAGVMKPEQVPVCTGVKIKAVALTSVLGTYDIIFRIGKPAFVELTTRKHNSEKVYTTKFDFQTPKNTEISMHVYDKGTQEQQAIIMARVRPFSPGMAEVDLVYRREEIGRLEVNILCALLYHPYLSLQVIITLNAINKQFNRV